MFRVTTFNLKSQCFPSVTSQYQQFILKSVGTYVLFTHGHINARWCTNINLCSSRPYAVTENFIWLKGNLKNAINFTKNRIPHSERTLTSVRFLIKPNWLSTTPAKKKPSICTQYIMECKHYESYWRVDISWLNEFSTESNNTNSI